MTDHSRLTPDIDAVDLNADGSVNDPLASSLTSSNISANNENDSIFMVAEDATSNSADDVGNTSRASVIDVKPNLVPIYEVHKANNEGIRKQLEDTAVEVIDDDIEITYTSKGFGRPLNATQDGLIKREHQDEVSGDFPFMNTVGIFSLKANFHSDT